MCGYIRTRDIRVDQCGRYWMGGGVVEGVDFHVCKYKSCHGWIQLSRNTCRHRSCFHIRKSRGFTLKDRMAKGWCEGLSVMCCSVLQCDTVYWSVLQYIAVRKWKQFLARLQWLTDYIRHELYSSHGVVHDWYIYEYYPIVGLDSRNQISGLIWGSESRTQVVMVVKSAGFWNLRVKNTF